MFSEKLVNNEVNNPIGICCSPARPSHEKACPDAHGLKSLAATGVLALGGIFNVRQRMSFDELTGQFNIRKGQFRP
ncbi:hypothetical protein NDU88_001847 [Pleurodeles waltl]|uniref:Uncharacterized protein n=1 Tax=Pleurodeles waltl TaxID=8319 RepID=A0AAV7KT06_PLEWA|nr:hypothetical protein NDU88_001847 [Pleurodeles waltl]